MFETALAETEQVTGMEASRDDVVVLLSQVLWALGGEEQRSVAKEELFRCIAQSPTHLRAIFGLGAMGLVQNDETLATAALKEVLKFSRAELQALDPERQADEMVAQYYQLLSEHRLAMSTLAKAVHERPSEAQAWQRLSEHLSQTATTWGAGGTTLLADAERMQKVAAWKNVKKEKIEEEERQSLGRVRTATTIAQRAVMAAPWNPKAWQ
ncbi:Superkiller protein 3, partial [Lunasporangiospora selenospora]